MLLAAKCTVSFCAPSTLMLVGDPDACAASKAFLSSGVSRICTACCWCAWKASALTPNCMLRCHLHGPGDFKAIRRLLP